MACAPPDEFFFDISMVILLVFYHLFHPSLYLCTGHALMVDALPNAHWSIMAPSCKEYHDMAMLTTVVLNLHDDEALVSIEIAKMMNEIAGQIVLEYLGTTCLP